MPGDGNIPFSIGGNNWPGLAKVLEEAGELSQVLGKIIAFPGEAPHPDGKGNLKKRAELEIGDLQAILEYFIEASGLDKDKIEEERDVKLSRFWRWHNAEQSVG